MGKQGSVEGRDRGREPSRMTCAFESQSLPSVTHLLPQVHRSSWLKEDKLERCEVWKEQHVLIQGHELMRCVQDGG